MFLWKAEGVFILRHSNFNVETALYAGRCPKINGAFYRSRAKKSLFQACS